MAWHTTFDLDEFDDVARAFLAAEPARNTMQLTLPAILRRRGADAFGTDRPRFGWCTSSETGQVVAAFVQTPPRPVLLTAMSADDAAALAETLDDVTGVSGPVAAADAFADARGGTTTVRARLRLYRLTTLTPPAPAPAGNARLVDESDRSLLISWWNAFAETAGTTPEDTESAVDDRIAYGGLTLWEVDGEPVSMAGSTAPVTGSIRIAQVYTPPELRRRGYAGAVTAAVSQRALEDGADAVVLFTDLENPTSNALYQRIGYAPVEDFLALTVG